MYLLKQEPRLTPKILEGHLGLGMYSRYRQILRIEDSVLMNAGRLQYVYPVLWSTSMKISCNENGICQRYEDMPMGEKCQ